MAALVHQLSMIAQQLLCLLLVLAYLATEVLMVNISPLSLAEGLLLVLECFFHLPSDARPRDSLNGTVNFLESDSGVPDIEQSILRYLSKSSHSQPATCARASATSASSRDSSAPVSKPQSRVFKSSWAASEAEAEWKATEATGQLWPASPLSPVSTFSLSWGASSRASTSSRHSWTDFSLSSGPGRSQEAPASQSSRTASSGTDGCVSSRRASSNASASGSARRRTSASSSASDEGSWALLGEGSFGKVYGDGDEAVKIMDCLTEKDRNMTRFEYQCMVTGSAASPNILSAHSISFSEDTAIYRMPRCQGSAEKWRLKMAAAGVKGRDREVLALGFLRQLLSAVRAAHEVVAVAHLDIKPENVLMTFFPMDVFTPIPTGTFKLADFGLAMAASECGNIKGARGTDDYMAPEMRSFDPELADGHWYPPPSTSSDLFSVGAAFWKMLFDHQYSFDGEEVNYPCMGMVSEETRAILDGLLEKRPEKRMNLFDLDLHLEFHPLLG